MSTRILLTAVFAAEDTTEALCQLSELLVDAKILKKFKVTLQRATSADLLDAIQQITPVYSLGLPALVDVLPKYEHRYKCAKCPKCKLNLRAAGGVEMHFIREERDRILEWSAPSHLNLRGRLIDNGAGDIASGYHKSTYCAKCGHDLVEQEIT